jgi:hypothetical protein
LSGGPPSQAAKGSSRALIEKDMQRLGIVGQPLSPAMVSTEIAKGWR